MNSAGAKFILAAFRPSTEDARDPVFSDALALLKSDSDLRNWYRAELELIDALRESLRKIEVPPSLRTEILVGMNASKTLGT